MRDYARVAPQFWTGETGRRLRAAGRDAQLVALYLLTAPAANMIGLYYVPLAQLEHETGLSRQGASEALRRVSEAGFASYDREAEVVFVREAARFQIGATLDPRDKRIKGVINQLAAVGKCRFVRDFWERYREAYHLPDAGPWAPNGKPLESPLEGPSKPLRSQEQEQEQEQEQAQEQEQEQHQAPLLLMPTPATRFLDAFNSAFERRVSITPKVVARIKARIAVGYTADQLVALPLLVAAGELPPTLRKSITPEVLLRDGRHPRTTRDGSTAGATDWLERELERADRARIPAHLVAIADRLGVAECLAKHGATLVRPLQPQAEVGPTPAAPASSVKPGDVMRKLREIQELDRSGTA